MLSQYTLRLSLIKISPKRWINHRTPFQFWLELCTKCFRSRADKQCCLGNSIIPWWLHTCGRKTDSNKHYGVTEVTNDLEKYSFYGYHVMKTSLGWHTSNNYFYFFAGIQIHALHEADIAFFFITQDFKILVSYAEVIKL